jgi:peptidoglycan glycosyltransferase
MGMIAGGGSAAEPYLVEEVSAGGSRTYSAKTHTTGRLMTSVTAEKLQDLMRNNVIDSYGDENFPGLTVCAKSGTAETGFGENNALFTGFVADQQYPLAFIVVEEEGGYGSKACIPVISKVLSACQEVLDGQ